MGERWAVVGGGMLGGTSALRLAQAGHRVTLFESQQQLGGLTSQLHHENIQWDRFYHVIEHSDSYLLSLIDELDLTDCLRWDTTKTNFYDGQKLYPLNNAMDYFRLPALNFIDKGRIALTILYGSSIKDGSDLENIPLSDWLIRWSGASGFHNLWLPLLRGKLGDNYKIASAAFIWSVIQRFYGARSGAKKTESFGYVEGGYARILSALVRSLETQGVKLRTGEPVSEIISQGGSFQVTTPKEQFNVDKVLVTTPSNIVGRMCSQLDDSEKAAHENLRYQGVVCVSLLMKKALGGAYLTYITEEDLPFTTIIEMTSLVSTKHYGNRHLIYLPKYVPAEHPLFEQPDELITETFVKGLQRIFPVLSKADILSEHVSRARQVTTIPTLNYSARKPTVITSVPGLYVSNSAQISNAALSVNESVCLADQTVARLLSHG
ncbi:MAG: NAD(P)/FAD-dependent oxidoreductase [Pseudomonadota bacterium]